MVVAATPRQTGVETCTYPQTWTAFSESHSTSLVVMEQSGSNDDAFGRFYDATSPAIRAYILRHCSDRDSVDDLFQITYVKFLTSPMAKTPDAPQARPYLYRIATNVIADHGRGLQKRNRQEAPERQVMATRPDTDIADVLALREALRTLSKREQQMLWLLYAEGFSHKEVARIMSLNRRSVRVLAFRARRKLADYLTRLTQNAKGASS